MKSRIFSYVYYAIVPILTKIAIIFEAKIWDRFSQMWDCFILVFALAQDGRLQDGAVFSPHSGRATKVVFLDVFFGCCRCQASLRLSSR